MDSNRDLVRVRTDEPDAPATGPDAGGVQGTNADDPAVRGMIRRDPPGVAPEDAARPEADDAGVNVPIAGSADPGAEAASSDER